MNFSKRLNRLMTVMGTNNNRLAMALNVDASLVSRWRTGNRTPKRIQNHAQSISAYYMRTAQSDYQRRALAELVGMPDGIPADEELSRMLADWLMEEETPQPSRDPLPKTSGTARERSIRMLLREKDTDDEMIARFMERIERPDCGDIDILCSGREYRVLNEATYEKLYQTFRFVLQSGRRIRAVFQKLDSASWAEFAFRWSDLAFYGDFVLSVMDPHAVCMEDFLCLCDRFGVEADGNQNLYYTDPDLIRLRRQRFHRLFEASGNILSRDPEREAPASGPVRIHTVLHMPVPVDPEPSRHILILPHLSFMDEAIRDGMPAESVQAVLSVLHFWHDRISEDTEHVYQLFSTTHLHRMHWNTMDIWDAADGCILRDAGTGSGRVRIRDGEWVENIRGFLSDTTRFLQDRDAILLQLEASISRLVSRTDPGWNPENTGADCRIRLTDHALYGRCMEYRGAEGEETQYYRIQDGDIHILHLADDPAQAETFAAFLKHVAGVQHSGLFLLADPAGSRDKWDRAVRFGFVPTGRLFMPDGSDCTQGQGTYGRIRAEMKLAGS